MKSVSRLVANLSLALLSLMVTAIILLGSAYIYATLKLPSVDSLKNIQLQTPLRIYTSDNKLMAQYGTIRRNYIPIEKVPKQLIEAVLATEDQRFFEHSGVDFISLARAAKQLILTGKKSQGASTITMQVARNFFLTRKKTFSRKFKEILLAIKIDKELSKNKILELYLNKIYLGQRAYGVAAAARVYYGKSLDQLNLAQLAMIAGLPQAPSRNNPITNPRAAKVRRNHVLYRMYTRGYITKQEYNTARRAPVTAGYHGQIIQIHAPYIAEMVRTAMLKQFGKSAYTDGLKVYTTINSKLQNDAHQSLQKGLIAYDKRYGYRQPTKTFGKPTAEVLPNWEETLKEIPTIANMQAAAVLTVDDQSVTALLADGSTAVIPWSGLIWAKPALSNQRYGYPPQHANQIVSPGDLIRVKQTANGEWQLAQTPQIQGALVSLNPTTGAILALSGGFSFDMSHYNRAIQAERQPGSGFKPFIYSAALEKGYTLASIINDAPVVQNDSGENSLWRPQNDTLRFYGPTRLRVGLTKSRNLVSIRLLRDIGIPYALNYIQHFGFSADKLPHSLSLALGAGATTPLQIATGYAVFANGGHQVTPFFIDHITNDEGEVIYQAKPDTDKQVISPENAYLMTTALQSVIQHGTGRAAKVLHRSDLAGKTGTTNNQMDAWFNGFNSSVVTTIWVGFDNPHSLREYGAQAALPIWIDFMHTALADTPDASMSQPDDIVTARIDPNTGLLAYPGEPNTIFETFRQAHVPTKQAPNPTTAQIKPTTDNSDNNETATLF